MSNRHDLIRSRWRADGSIRFYRDEPTLPGVSELQNCNAHGIAPTIVQSGGGYSDNRAMNLTLTTATGRYPRIGGAEQIVNVTQGGCAATITARYSAMCYSNILTLAHYPMTAILREYD